MNARPLPVAVSVLGAPVPAGVPRRHPAIGFDPPLRLRAEKFFSRPRVRLTPHEINVMKHGDSKGGDG